MPQKCKYKRSTEASKLFDEAIIITVLTTLAIFYNSLDCSLKLLTQILLLLKRFRKRLNDDFFFASSMGKKERKCWRK